MFVVQFVQNMERKRIEQANLANKLRPSSDPSPGGRLLWAARTESAIGASDAQRAQQDVHQTKALAAPPRIWFKRSRRRRRMLSLSFRSLPALKR